MPSSSQKDYSQKKIMKKQEAFSQTATLQKINIIRSFISSRTPKINLIDISSQLAAIKSIATDKHNEHYSEEIQVKPKTMIMLPMVLTVFIFWELSVKNKPDMLKQKTII